MLLTGLYTVLYYITYTSGGWWSLLVCEFRLSPSPYPPRTLTVPSPYLPRTRANHLHAGTDRAHGTVQPATVRTFNISLFLNILDYRVNFIRKINLVVFYSFFFINTYFCKNSKIYILITFSYFIY